MNLNYILSMYFIVVIVIFLVLIRSDKEFTNAFFFSILIGFIFLIITKPPNQLNMHEDDISAISIYFAVVFISFFTILIYSVVMSIKNMNIKKVS